MPSNVGRVLAFDPGFERLGVAVVEKNTPTGGGKEVLLHSECIRTNSKTRFEDRLLVLGHAVEELIAQWQPGCIALEDIYFAKNEKTAIKIAEVRGVLSYLAVVHKLRLFQYTPLEVKVAITGYGRSDKAAVAAMIPKLVALPKRARLDDEMDAIAIGLTCLASARLV